MPNKLLDSQKDKNKQREKNLSTSSLAYKVFSLPVCIRSHLCDMRLCRASQELFRVSYIEEEILHVNWGWRVYPATQYSTVFTQGDLLKSQDVH